MIHIFDPRKCKTVCVFIHQCPTLCDPRDYSPQGSSVQGIFQAGIQRGLPGCQVLRGNFLIRESSLSVLSPALQVDSLPTEPSLDIYKYQKICKVKKQLGKISAGSDRVSHCLLESFEMLAVFSSLTPHKQLCASF